jgi:predicted dehydrogenase
VKDIRWGILAPGHIAYKFAAAMSAVGNSRVESVASRDPERARAFAAKFSVPRISEDYEALAADPDIDAVYIASPNACHRDHAVLCLEAGKAVLCEKPLAVTADEAETMAASARSRGVFLMEGLWTRTLPAVLSAARAVRQGEIGSLLRLEADYSFDFPVPGGHRLIEPSLGGGALLDAGVYLLHLARLFAGVPPKEVHAVSSSAPTGVDLQTLIHLEYDSGLLAQLSCGIRVDGRRDLRLIGDRGVLEIAAPLIAAETALIRNDRGERRIDEPHRKNGFEYEIEEANRCIRRGLGESPLVPLDESLEVLRLLTGIGAAGF